jgi:hypothetical protein
MKITLNKQEAERMLTHYFNQRLDEHIEHVQISDMEPVREVHAVTYTSLMVQELWMEFMEPTNNEPNFAPVKIRLIKLYMGLYHKLTGRQCSLVEAKKFIEIHQTHY